MKILIISGFLGVGKTRFIQEMARQTKQQFVIVENEFGKMGVDRQTLQNTLPEKLNVWELSEGCICCSLDLDFSYTVLTIANSLNPDYLVIEPSGVAKLSNILKQLNKISYEQIQIAAPITIIDGQNFADSQHNFPEYFSDQLRAAQTIVVSKSESWRSSDFNTLKTQLNLPENIHFPRQHYSKWLPEHWQNLLNTEIENSATFKYSLKNQERLPEKTLENVSITPKFANLDQLAYVLFLLTTGKFGKIARAKGACEIGGFWVKFDLVNYEYAITGSDALPEAMAVVIGQYLQHNEIKDIFTVYE